MGVTRVQAIGPGSVEYLLKGCDPAHAEPEAEREPGDEGPEAGGEGPEREKVDPGIGYFLEGKGEPTGVWLGSGMEGLGLSMRSGQQAREDDLRPIFGELRFPNSERENSTRDHPVYLGAKPRSYQTLAERVDAALKAEPDASEERRHEIEVNVARYTKSNTAYYDVTFSPDKSVSVYFAALLAAGETELAQQVRKAHDQAIRMAIESVEADVAWAKTGRHGRASDSGRTTGQWEKATGFSAVLFAHHTNRDGEPQLHAHVGVLNRVATPDGRVYAMDGAAFRPVKDAMTAAYDRAFEAILSDLTGVTWVERVDGHGRSIAGIDPALMEEASTRSREHVEPRIEELTSAYRERHGYDPGPQARRKIVDQAVKDTRRPKSGPAGPAAVEAWIAREDGRRDRLEAALDSVDDAVAAAAAAGWPRPAATGHVVDGQVVAIADAEVATGHEGVATPEPGVASGQPGVASAEAASHARAGGGQAPAAGMASEAQAVMRDELGRRAVLAGLESVQAKYPNWSIGSLVGEIDRHLGPNVNAVGLGITERRQWVRSLAQAAVAPGADAGVVQVSMGDPIPVPEEMRRAEDGRSILRAPIDERYATAAHLSTEERLVATATAPVARTLDERAVGQVAEQAGRDGLSADQVDAVTTVLSSRRQVEVLVGPAGAGKSHTLGRLAEVWAEQHGGRVFGTATAEVATRNLAETGMDALNLRALVTRLTPDEQGRVRMQLRENDLLVIDEAGMVSTSDLDEVMAFAVAARCKVIWAGDHRQLPAVGAGGVFAHLAERTGAIELEKVHRFRAEWEREASLKLRAGDGAAAVAYADNGRLRAGTREQMEYLATRDYLADRLDGASSLLIVGSNDRAAQLSNDIQAQMAKLGLIGGHGLMKLSDRNWVRMGDVVLAREGSRSIRVEGGVDEHGHARQALPVANRELYTVVGYDPSTATVYGRDERGAVAHFTEEYLKTSMTLAYAVTNHAAQGVSVDRGRPLAERGTSLEALYPQATRGRSTNVIYLETDIDPDPHNPQRERDTAIAAMIRMIETEAGELTDAALTVREHAEAEARSMHTLAEHYDRIAANRGHSRHSALAVERFGAGVEREAGFGALLGRMRAMELAGHDITAVFDEAIAMSRLGDAREFSKVMHWRLGVLQNQRTPEQPREQGDTAHRHVRPAWEQLAEQHRARAAETGSPFEVYLADAAEHAHERTTELGAQVAAEQPAWAREWLGELPDPAAQPAEHADWVREAGQVAAYREWRGIPEEQVSIGQAPPPAQQLAHELWLRATEAGNGDPRAVDWRQASDHELREAIARWEREQQWAPPQVSPERGEALALAHDAANDATVGRARLAAMGPDDPGRERLETWVAADEVLAEQAAGFAAGLDQAHTDREAWWEQTRDQREAAHGAEAELSRRGLSRDEEPELDPAEGTDADLIEPEGSQLDTAPEAPVAEPTDAEPEREEVAERRSGHDRFLDGLAVEHERQLDEVDPDGQMAPESREAAVRARNYDRFIAELRAEHGTRLDPDGQLSDLDLAHARARELADPAATRPAPEQPEAPTEAEAAASAEPEASERKAAAAEPEHAELAVEQDVEPEVDRAAAEPTDPGREHEAETAAAPGGDGLAELRRVAREDRAARITREAEQARQAEADRPDAAKPEPADPRRELAAEFEREANLDDELSAHRAPQQQREAELERERQRDTGPEID